MASEVNKHDCKTSCRSEKANLVCGEQKKVGKRVLGMQRADMRHLSQVFTFYALWSGEYCTWH